ncbi:MAG: hypothetical protein JW870_20835 [Candidatus Delongbacteria bacterium]|nr:hypothetical protein [Candidatus Delongbacteria bacterium]
MLISKIDNNNTSVVCVHAEQVYNNLQISKRNTNRLSTISSDNELNEEELEINIIKVEKGIFCSTLTYSPLKEVCNYYAEHQEIKIVILDFNHIRLSQKNSHLYFQKLIENSTQRILIIRNLSSGIIDSSILSLIGYEEQPFYEEIIYNLKSLKIDKKELAKCDFTNHLENRLKEYFFKKDFEYHYSSSIYLNRYIDIKTILNSGDRFFLYCIYNLALKAIQQLKKNWKINKGDSDYILLCQTLNGAFIASILAELLLLDITYIDHLGPINKIYNSYNSALIEKEKKYIVVSDVVCLGTEVKIAKNIIEFAGGFYAGNISFIRIKTSEDSDKKFSNVEYLYEISNKRNILNYKVKTALDFKPLKNE